MKLTFAALLAVLAIPVLPFHAEEAKPEEKQLAAAALKDSVAMFQSQYQAGVCLEYTSEFMEDVCEYGPRGDVLKVLGSKPKVESYRIVSKPPKLFLESWVSQRFSREQNKQIDVRENVTRMIFEKGVGVSFNGVAMPHDDKSRLSLEYLSMFNTSPLTYLFGFMTPGQGFTSFDDVLRPSSISDFLAQLKGATKEPNGDVLLETFYPGQGAESVKLNAARGLLPESYTLSANDSALSVQVKDWLQIASSKAWVPKEIVIQIGKPSAPLVQSGTIRVQRARAFEPADEAAFEVPAAKGK